MACPKPTYFEKFSSGGTAGTYTLETRDVKDPAQGNYLNNCSFIAVLSSLAWKKAIPALKTHTINLPLKDPYTFKFYINETTFISQKTNGTLPQDANRKLLHAKSDTSAIEIWPALWEKAYYQWLDNLPKETDQPDYCLHTEWQSPLTLLRQLTGKIPVQNISNGSSTLDATAVFSDIDSWCNSCPIATYRSIKSPAVAWSYDPIVANPAKVQFSSNTIAAQHTYSLLGVAAENYIVLRNPYGSGKREPDPALVALKNTDALWCSTSINLVYTTDGIFAISADDFVKYFAGYAWMPL
jgi:hypothetical protein